MYHKRILKRLTSSIRPLNEPILLPAPNTSPLCRLSMSPEIYHNHHRVISILSNAFLLLRGDV